ncbi:SRPBCC family protein [Arsenicicoccus dermatophilus]|uniref:SRPBCC family protein n=1 Tax=Arsenicicoccus dermatophilus TaxID=1076331 RepID=UPI001F4CE098|nr:SRPBCC family protein [Arsenicicoccus dermatophilus]MCH8613854.1 SRPBCC family protein [Arsenicicoccus dermatophilus]
MGRVDRLRANLTGAARMAAHLATGPIHSQERRSWGATPEETEAFLPGDELIRDVDWRSTRAVTVWAPAERVWPWLAQLGRGRAGFYSYDLLEQLAGSLDTSVARIVPELQDIRTGDQVRLHPQLPPLVVARLQPGAHLVLAGMPGKTDLLPSTVWSYHLHPLSQGRTRLIERNAYAHGDGLVERLTGGPYVIEPVSFVMSREMLLTIKRLAEQPQHAQA